MMNKKSPGPVTLAGVLFVHLLIFIIALVLIIPACSTRFPPIEPVGTNRPLPTGAETTVFPPSSPTMAALAQLDSMERHRINGLIIGLENEVVLERYFNGRDEGSIQDIRSATKSITAILVGIAIDQGVISGVDMPIADILQPAYPDIHIPLDLTIYDLLTMSSGKDCDDWDRTSPGNENRMYRRRDWTEFFLSLQQAREPGMFGSYCTGGVIALGRVLELSLSRPLDEWADEVLFEPLGIGNYRWEYYDGGRGVDTGGHMHISPRGLLSIGFMLLNGGSFGGASIVSPEWISEMWTPRTDLSGQAYGYLWWLNTVDYGSGPIEVFTARGNGGQNLFLVPSLNLSTVIMTSYYNDPKAVVSDQLFFNAILQDVINMKQSR
jgi:CubicO group peptidase (beta-lactamase class C family)